MDDVLDGFQRKARDHARTPIQWTSQPHAGFTTGIPWMRVNDDYVAGWNAEAERKDLQSVFHFWKRALALRKEHEVFVGLSRTRKLYYYAYRAFGQVYGDFQQLLIEHESVFAYTRSLDGTTAVILLNFTDKNVLLESVPSDVVDKDVIFSNYEDAQAAPSIKGITLRGYEGRIYL